MIAGVGKVVVPVEDQAQAKAFWTDRAGFTVRQDEAYGDERWIEIASPGPGPVLVLSPRPAGQRRPDVPDELPHSPVFFTCADIWRTYEEMRALGVEFPAPPARMMFGWWALFADEDGNRYAGRVEDGTRTFVGPARFRYALDDDGGIRLAPDGSLAVTWWLRDERGDWAPWMQNRFVRTR